MVVFWSFLLFRCSGEYDCCCLSSFVLQGSPGGYGVCLLYLLFIVVVVDIFDCCLFVWTCCPTVSSRRFGLVGLLQAGTNGFGSALTDTWRRCVLNRGLRENELFALVSLFKYPFSICI